MDNEVLHLDRICRSCLSEDGEMRSLFTIEENLRQHEPRLNQMLMSISQIQIKENDSLPCQICVHCAQQLYSAYSFKHMCGLSDAKLKRYISKSTPPSKRNFIDGSTTNCTGGVKEEHSTAGNNEIIDFNTMFNPDLPSIKMEARETTENHSIYEDEIKKDISSDATATMKENEKYTQTALGDVIHIHNCSHCQKKFKSLFSLSSHVKKHMATDAVPCVECGKLYISQEHLDKHSLQVHGITVPKNKALPPSLNCQDCKLTFKRIENLKKHMLVHGKKKIYNCENCDLGYNKYEIYQTHISSCAGKLHPCPICKKVFRSTEALFLHNELHENELESMEAEKKIEIQPIELTDSIASSQANGMNLDEKNSRRFVFSEMHIIPPTINIKEEPLEELLEEAERENQILEEDADSYTDVLVDNVMDGNSEEFNSDCSEYKPLQLKKRKSIRSGKKSFDAKRKHKLKRFKKEKDIDDIGEFPCTICSRVLNTETNLKVHMAKHSGDTILFSCMVCAKTFTNVLRLRRHETAHESFNKYKCDSCEKTFSRQDHLNKHMWSHVETKPYMCDLCPKGFFKAEHLERHKVALHSGKQKNPKTAFCSICSRGFTTSKYLETHMRMHTGDKTFTCKVCDKSFNSKWHLKEHNKWHSAEKPFLCSECGQRFIRNDYLVIHMRRHKGEKPYKCKFCGKGFPRATDLTVHERYHTGEKTHLCTICGKGFQRQYNLTVHLRVHTGEKPYVCSYCGKRFAQGNDLKSHVRRHTGERFNCEICGEGFIQGYHLTQHKRSVHGIDCTSHIRRVEKHPQANPQNQTNQTPKHRTRVVPNHQHLAAQMAATLSNELQEDNPVLQFSNASGDTQTSTINSGGSENDTTDITNHQAVNLQSQLAAAQAVAAEVERSNSMPTLMPIVPLALFPTMHTRMH